MTNDPVNYVRQGALIASALIMIQQTEVTCPKVSLDTVLIDSLFTNTRPFSFVQGVFQLSQLLYDTSMTVKTILNTTEARVFSGGKTESIVSIKKTILNRCH